MAEDGGSDDSDKTEDPTPKKLEESRKRGQVPVSREVNTWFMLLMGTLAIAIFLPGAMAEMAVLMRVVLEQSWQVHTDLALQTVLMRLMLQVFFIFGIVLGVLFFSAMVGPFAQIGPLLTWETIKPKLNKVSPVQGMKRIFSKKSLFEFVKGILKVGLVTTVTIIVLKPYLNEVEHFMTLPVSSVLEQLMGLFIKLMIAVLVLMALLAGMDLLFQRYTHYLQMRMSRQEIKDEYRQSEGDPHVRGKIRQLRMERAQNRMMQNVPSATVVVTNPTHFAVALKYDPDEMDAPVCVAKGQDYIALKIREIAKDNGVIVVESPPLARTLFSVIDIDQAVPPEHYKAVAEVISYVFRMQKKL